MNEFKAALGLVAAGALTRQDWILILGIIVAIAGMIQDYLKERK